MLHILGVLMVKSLPEINLIWISVCRPQHASTIIAQHKDLKMHPRTKVTTQIIKRGIRTISVQIHMGLFPCCNPNLLPQRDKNWCTLGASLCSIFLVLYITNMHPLGKCSQEPPAHGVHCSSQRSEFKDWIFKKCFHRSVGLLSSTFYYKICTLACIICGNKREYDKR